MFKSRKLSTLRILAATRNTNVPGLLSSLSIPAVEAISTQGVYQALSGCNLVVLDPGDLIPSPEITLDLLQHTLDQSGVPATSGAEFVANPQSWLERAAAATGLLASLPPKLVVLASYTGGVGKTTLVLNLARYVAENLRLRAAVLEAVFGVGALHALTDPTLPDLYDVLTQSVEPGTWTRQAITVLPMRYASARLLLQRQDDVAALVSRIRQSHALTIVDAHAANPLFDAFCREADRVFVVAAPRPDALVNAQALLSDAAALRPALIINQMSPLVDRLALSKIEAVARLPVLKNPDDRRLTPYLAESLLAVIYPGWDSNTKRKVKRNG